MEIPRLLLRRIRDASCPEELVRSAISEVAVDDRFAPEEVFALLVMAYRVETRSAVLETCVQGIVDTLARAAHTDFLGVQLTNFLSDKSNRSARVLIGTVAEPRVPAELRLAALDLIADFDDGDLNATRREELELVLAARMADEGEHEEIAKRVAASRWRSPS